MAMQADAKKNSARMPTPLLESCAGPCYPETGRKLRKVLSVSLIARTNRSLSLARDCLL